MRTGLFGMVVAVWGAMAGVGMAATDGPPSLGYRMTWADEFDGTTLNPARWAPNALGKRHDAINTADNIALDGQGHLVITTSTDEQDGRPVVHSAMVSTRHLFEQRYGYFEARIAFHDAPGGWSAFWLQSRSMGRPVNDPQRAGIEIDIVEHRAVDTRGRNIAASAQHTLHWNGYGKEHRSAGKLVHVPGLDQGFHVYGFEWTPTAYRYFFDGKLTWEVRNAPISQHPEFILLSSEVRNRGWAGVVPDRGYGDRAHSPVKMVVDYVRVYAAPPAAAP